MSAKWLLALGLILLFTLQFSLFMPGYRLTADDALFLQYAWRGWDHVWQAASETAIHNGRIGQYLMTPLNALGSYLAGNVIARGVMVAGYYGVMALFSLYASHLIAKGSLATTAFIFLCLLSLNPLVYEHMPPNSYPLQNTPSFLIIISIRLYMWVRPQLSTLLQSMLYAVMALAMLVSEFAILLATALMAVEHLANAASPQPDTHQKYLGPIPIRARRLIADGALAVVVLTAYLAFRVIFPSQYDGNTPDGLSNIGRFLWTALLHSFAGTAFYRIPSLEFTSVTAATWIVATLVGVVTLACCWYLLPKLPRFSPRKTAVLSGVCLLFMLYMTMPLAATSKQQQWCLEGGDCGYLDSRMAYLGIGILLLCLVSALSLVIKRGRPRQLAFALTSFTLGSLATLNHAGNQLMAIDMERKSEAWDKARRIACNDDIAGSPPSDLAIKIDPDNRVAFHPDMDRHDYWQEYIQYLQNSGQCDTSD